jgi:Tol biopolymer transport system component
MKHVVRVVTPPRHLVLAACVILAASAFAGTASSMPQSGPGGLIVFHKEGGAFGDGQLFTIRPYGTHLYQLTHGPTSSLNADWSPDGTTIAFAHYLPDRSPVSRVNADGSNVREVTPEGNQDTPSFTPDGKALVYTRDPSPSENGLWTIGVDGTGLRQLTSNPYIHAGECGCDYGAKMSPDGKTLAFVRIKEDNVTQALFTVRADGSGLKQRLPYRPAVGNHLDWAPNGKRIAITVGVDFAPGKSANVAIVRPDGKDLRWVTHFKGGDKNAFVGGYSPDGRWLVIRVDGATTHTLYVVHPEGGALHRIYSAPDIERGIDWGTGG